MAISLSIVPLTDSIDMYGEPDGSSAYSVSGHVSISLSSSTSLFYRCAPTRLLLQSLSITFEGQTELLSPETGYSGLRLCSVSQELAPSQSIELSNEGMEDSDRPCTWNIVFNLTIPGWLPPTHVFGDCQRGPAGTKYALYATAKFANVDETPSSSSWISTLCSPFSTSTRLTQATPCPITLNRRHTPPPLPASESSDFSMLSYSVTALDRGTGKVPPNSIPIDILSKLQVIVSLPERIDAKRESFPFSLRLRAPELSDEEVEKIRLTEFVLDIQQHEKYQIRPSPSYTFPLPKPENQPPAQPLLVPHPDSSYYELGIMSSPSDRVSCTRTFSLCPDYINTEFLPSNEGKIFRRGPEEPDRNAWYAMHVTLPFVNEHEHVPRKSRREEWAGVPKLRLTESSPLLGVKHTLQISIVVKYMEEEEEEELTEKLVFALPLKFVHLRSSSSSPSFTESHIADDGMVVMSHGHSDSTDSLDAESISETAPLMPPSRPYNAAPSLPSYKELYYSNGERRIDETTPLPVYTKTPSEAPPPHLSPAAPACPLVALDETKQSHSVPLQQVTSSLAPSGVSDPSSGISSSS